MRLALALLLAACGGSAPRDPIAHHAPDDRRIVERFEIRGVSAARADELRALVRPHIAPGIELTSVRYEAAHEAILSDYLDRGHVEAKLTWPDFDAVKGPFALVLTISEGPRYTVAALAVAGVPEADRPRYVALSPLRVGEPYSRTKLATWVQAVADAVGGKAQPEITIDRTTTTISLTVHAAK